MQVTQSPSAPQRAQVRIACRREEHLPAGARAGLARVCGGPAHPSRAQPPDLLRHAAGLDPLNHEPDPASRLCQAGRLEAAVVLPR